MMTGQGGRTMRGRQLLGAVLVIFGLLILFLLRRALLNMIMFVLEFLAVLLGLALVVLGVALLLGRRWFWSSSRSDGHTMFDWISSVGRLFGWSYATAAQICWKFSP